MDIPNISYTKPSFIAKNYNSTVSKVLHTPSMTWRVSKKFDKHTTRLDMIYNEINNVKRLQTHPNIVHFYEALEDMNYVYMVTDMYASELSSLGGHLIEIVDDPEKDKENELQLLELIKYMMLALHHCHSKNIIHGDIKPTNFMLAVPNVFTTIQLIDFGSSVNVETDEYLKLKRTGSYYYAAPESYSAIRTYASDIYSVGMCVKELLLGHRESLLTITYTHEDLYKDKRFRKLSSLTKLMIRNMLRVDKDIRYNAVDVINMVFDIQSKIRGTA